MNASLLSLLLLISLSLVQSAQPTYEFYPKAYVASKFGRALNLDTEWNARLTDAAQIMEDHSFTATHIAKISLPLGHPSLRGGAAADIYRLASLGADGFYSLDLSPDVLRTPGGQPLALRINNGNNYAARLTTATAGGALHPHEEALFVHPGGVYDINTVRASEVDPINIEHFSAVVPGNHPRAGIVPSGYGAGRVTVGWMLAASNSLGGDAISLASGRANMHSLNEGWLWNSAAVAPTGIQFRGGHTMAPLLHPESFAQQRIPRGWFSWFR